MPSGRLVSALAIWKLEQDPYELMIKKIQIGIVKYCYAGRTPLRSCL